jgi:hypothetical protein
MYFDLMLEQKRTEFGFGELLISYLVYRKESLDHSAMLV